MPPQAETILPNDQDVQQARDFSASLAPLAEQTTARLHLQGNSGQEAQLTLPQPVLRVLLGVLAEMGQGHGVRLTRLQKEFTTQQAADFLMVSRPYLIKELLEKGVLPFRKVGNRRRIRVEDLLRYQEAEEREIARRETVMQELMAETERLGLYR